MGEWTDHWDWWDSTKIWRYWLVPVSCVFHHTLYYLLKKYLVRKVCDPIVRKQSRSVTTNDYTNGEYKSNGHNAARPNELQSTKGEGVKRLSDADVSDISAKYDACECHTVRTYIYTLKCGRPSPLLILGDSGSECLPMNCMMGKRILVAYSYT